MDITHDFLHDFTDVEIQKTYERIGNRFYIIWVFRCGKFINHGPLDDETWYYAHFSPGCEMILNPKTIIFVNEWCSIPEYQNYEDCHEKDSNNSSLSNPSAK